MLKPGGKLKTNQSLFRSDEVVATATQTQSPSPVKGLNAGRGFLWICSIRATSSGMDSALMQILGLF